MLRLDQLAPTMGVESWIMMASGAWPGHLETVLTDAAQGEDSHRLLCHDCASAGPFAVARSTSVRRCFRATVSSSQSRASAELLHQQPPVQSDSFLCL